MVVPLEPGGATLSETAPDLSAMGDYKRLRTPRLQHWFPYMLRQLQIISELYFILISPVTRHGYLPERNCIDSLHYTIYLGPRLLLSGLD